MNALSKLKRKKSANILPDIPFSLSQGNITMELIIKVGFVDTEINFLLFLNGVWQEFNKSYARLLCCT